MTPIEFLNHHSKKSLILLSDFGVPTRLLQKKASNINPYKQ